MTTSAVYSRWIRSDYAKKAQKVVLAAAVFDQRGRIMVSKEGLLPSEVVTDTYIPTVSIAPYLDGPLGRDKRADGIHLVQQRRLRHVQPRLPLDVLGVSELAQYNKGH